MKDCTITVVFTTHVLANNMGNRNDKDCFQRDNENNIIYQQAWWFSAFTRAIELAHIRGIKASDISMNLSVKAATDYYNRRYGDGKFRLHEAIMPGTHVTFEAVVSDHVTESNLRLILDRMGKFVGLSPYGYRLGFGKFNLVKLEVAPSEPLTTDTGKHETNKQDQPTVTTETANPPQPAAG
jgi:hypothetical protein